MTENSMNSIIALVPQFKLVTEEVGFSTFFLLFIVIMIISNFLVSGFQHNIGCPIWMSYQCFHSVTFSMILYYLTKA